MAVFVGAGPREAQGDTPNLLLSSNNDNMLFSADGEQTVIGPGKLRVTGKQWPHPPGSRRGHFAFLPTHFPFKGVK